MVILNDDTYLNKLRVLVSETSAHCHRVPITSARVRRRAAEIGTPVSTRRQHSVRGVDPVNVTSLHIHGHGTNTLPLVIHYQIQGKVLDEIGRVKGQRATVEGVEHCMTGSVRSCAAAVCL